MTPGTPLTSAMYASNSLNSEKGKQRKDKMDAADNRHSGTKGLPLLVEDVLLLNDSIFPILVLINANTFVRR